MTPWHSVYASGTRISGHRFRPGHEALDVAPNTAGDYAILGQMDGWVENYGNDDPIEQSPGSASRGIWVIIRHEDGTSVEHCHLAGVPWPVDGRYTPEHFTGNPIGEWVHRGQPTGFFTGLTGDTTGYHDHLIARDANGKRIDPEPLLFGEDAMNDAQKAEAQAVADILDSWALNNERREQAALAAGYGINDSYSNRQASDLRGLALRVRGLEAL